MHKQFMCRMNPYMTSEVSSSYRAWRLLKMQCDQVCFQNLYNDYGGSRAVKVSHMTW